MKKIPQLFAAICLLVHTGGFAQKYPFQDPRLPLTQRVNDLISRLTLKEKVDQMMNSTPAIERLGIPAYDWWNECLHGVARTPYHVTSYPQAIGMAATFDREAMEQMGDYTSDEGRAIYNESIRRNDHRRYLGLTYWTPNINIFRDPRWGRGQETYGEDPFLTGSMASAFVSGLQGHDPRYLKAAACAKHYAIHSGPESSRHVFDVRVSPHDLWDTYLPAFRELVVHARVAGVMCAYNAYAGQPCCGSDTLMVDILRNRWKFKGYVTSDCGAIDDFYQTHKMFPDAETSASAAVLHGTDVECGNQTYRKLVQAVADGKVTEKDIDRSLRRLFTIRFRLGMFDPPSMVKYSRIPITDLEAPAHGKLALKMAEESIVLLRNQGGLLPLSTHLRRIAVLGPNANNPGTQLGNYNGQPSVVTTVLQALRSRGSQTSVFYSKATDFVSQKVPDFSKLIDSVRSADVIIFVGGISPRLEGEEMKVDLPGFSGGDRTSIDLPAVQTACLKALESTGKPIVLVLMTGSALAIPWEEQHIPAILNAWYPGQAGGTAVANVLFGNYNPSGRLPVTFYQSDKDLPPFEDYSMANRTYRYFKGTPLYPFGFGLSYTHFTYSDLKLSSYSSHHHNPVDAWVTVTNTGKRDGQEVVELYLSHLSTGPLFPLYALKGFQRIQLGAGSSKRVHFVITPRMLQLVNSEGRRAWMKGNVQIAIGGSLPGPRSEALGAAQPARAILRLQ